MQIEKKNSRAVYYEKENLEKNPFLNQYKLKLHFVSLPEIKWKH